MDVKLNTQDAVSASVERNTGLNDNLDTYAIYKAECYAADGTKKWEAETHNTVCTLGKNDLLNKYFSNTAAGASFLGLIGAVGYTGVPVASDTMASHGTWTECGLANAPTYTTSGGANVRKTLTAAWAAAAAGVLTTSATQDYTINSDGTVKGAFINIGGTSAVDNTTGILYSAGLFSAPGDRLVASTDVVKVTVTLTHS